MKLTYFFQPQGIAVFGSMKEDWFFGAGVVVKELKGLGYTGSIHPIHPTAQSVYGLKVYPDISQVEGRVDLAVIATSYRSVPGILKACGSKGVKAVVVISDGFAENGDDGRARQDEIVEIARAMGIRIIGPNTLGIYKPHSGVSTIPYEKGCILPPKGGLSIITQTGMYGPQATALNEYAFGINTIIDLGNMCDIDEVDSLEYLEADPDTKVIGLYLEHTWRAKALRETARRVSKSKPILCLKGGRSSEAARAMASHTGSIAGRDGLYDALFRQAGIIRVEDYEDLLEVAKVFLSQPLPVGNRIGIISLTGAIGIQCIDIAAQCGLVPGELSRNSREDLLQISHTLSGHPIDLGPASATGGPNLFSYYEQCFDILMADEGIDCVYLNTYISSYLTPEIYDCTLSHMGANLRKPVTSWSYGPSSEAVRQLGALTEMHGIPFYPTTRKAIKALGYLVNYAKWKRSDDE
ncbi:MAG: CoA-binding protein [Desulfomonilia bacterium]|jgi:acyl-CoA synthetase (NDP forming)